MHKVNYRTRRKIKLGLKKTWRNLLFKNRTIKKIRKASRNSPNKTEKYLWKLLNQWFSNKFEFVGNGKLIIGEKNPDFWDGNTKLIELYGNYWHKGQIEKSRIDYFKIRGYETLIIWECELKNKSLLYLKIKKFIGEV